MAFDVVNNGEDGLVVRNKLNGNFTNAVETTDARLGSVGYADLDPAAALTRAELVAISQGGVGKKTTINDILNSNLYGGLIAINNATAEGAIAAFPATKIVQAWTANEPNNGLVPDHTTGNITVPAGGGGLYFVSANIASYVGSNAKEYSFGFFKNSDLFAFRLIKQNTSGSGVGGNLALTGVIQLAAGDTVSMGALSSDGGTVLTISFADIFVQRVGA